MAANDLEAVLFQMVVDLVCPLPISFVEKAQEIAAKSSGRLLFDIRIDGDRSYQRAAAVKYANDEVGVIALDRDGASIRTCIVDEAFSSFIEPLEEWGMRPLRDQARIDIQGHASLFLGALRNSGYLKYDH